MLRVGIDLQSLANIEKSGVENYIRDLALRLPQEDRGIQYFYYVNARISPAELTAFKQPNVSIIRIPTRHQKLFNLALRLLVKIHRLDLFHSPLCFIPRKFGVPTVITIYDLTYERYPEFYAPFVLNLQKSLIPSSAKRAVGILTISEATKRDICEFYGINESKIFVTYPNIRQDLMTDKITKGRDYPYVLCVGNVQPRKNLPNAVKAFAQLKDPTLHLIIAGKIQDEAELAKLQRVTKDARLESRVEVTGYVTEAELGSLYANSEFVLFPSYYEGFGYPIIEAFASGKAIVTSNTSSMPELAGEGGVFVDPNDSESIASGMKRLLDKQVRQKIAHAGETRLKQLQQHSCAKETVAIYKKLTKKSV